MENDKSFYIRINGDEEFELDRFNSALVRYLGNLAIHDHVHLATEYGTGYIFQDQEGFNEVAEYMEENNYPQALYCPQVPSYVVDKHADAIQAISETDIDEELEKWQRLFKNENGHE